jgi:hypothetical protein
MSKLSLAWLTFIIVFMVTGCALGVDQTLTNSPIPDPATQVIEASITPTPTSTSQPFTATAEATPSRIYALGFDVNISPNECFDFDSGQVVGADQPGCDFSFQKVPDLTSRNILFQPFSRASFAFMQAFWDAPDEKKCLELQSYTDQREELTTSYPYYVCFQTSEGRYGSLYFKSYIGDIFTFDWTTFDYLREMIAQLPTPTIEVTPVIEAPDILVQGKNLLLKYKQGLDLDTGAVGFFTLDVFDLYLAPGPEDESGRVYSVILTPSRASGFEYGTMLHGRPSLEDCKSNTILSNAPQELSGDGYSICFQTNEGRMGYIYFLEVNEAFGVRIDWVTWQEIQPLQIVNAIPSLENQVSAADKASLSEEPDTADGAVFDPRKYFHKTWIITNSGNTTWTKNYSIVFAGGNLMTGRDRTYLHLPIPPGGMMNIELWFVAPDAYGTYIAKFLIENQSHEQFGVGESGDQPLTLVINVGDPGETLAEGREVRLESGACFDLDLGYASFADDACDFAISKEEDSSLIRLESPMASFDFIDFFERRPRLVECTHARLSRGDQVLGFSGGYVCYKTNQDRFGWMYLHSIEDGIMQFDWKTYR